jgi:hypothetical protein
LQQPAPQEGSPYCDIDDLEIATLAPHISRIERLRDLPARWTKEMQMTDGLTPKAPGRVRGRPFEKGRSGNPLGRRVGCRNKTTIAAAALLAGEAEALTRKAVELALVGDPTALRLCIERILPQCRERAVKFALPPIESAADIAPAMKAVTSALADGMITPAEAATIAAVVDTFMRAIETSDFERRLRLVEADHFNQPGEAAGMYGGTPNGYRYNP